MEAGTAEEQEERKAQDGSLWWHGMFVKAGRMGNMAAEVQAGSKPEVRALFVQASTRHTPCTSHKNKLSISCLGLCWDQPNIYPSSFFLTCFCFSPHCHQLSVGAAALARDSTLLLARPRDGLSPILQSRCQQLPHAGSPHMAKV